MPRPIVLIHGYSDKGESLRAWRDALVGKGAGEAIAVHLSQYVSLSNEITIKDIAEGLDRALRTRLGPAEEFDAIVHSTGMLVIREWLTTYAARAGRLKHLIGLAPATFGSPLAHKGRGPLGGLFKGSKDIDSPDFLEAGDRILAALELGSSYTWNLAHKDLVGETPAYGPGADTPYPFVFIGLDDYGLVKRALTQEGRGTDGTVRWAAAGLDCRKFTIDLRIDASAGHESPTVSVRPVTDFAIPLTFIPGRNHGSILHDPPGELVAMVVEALAVETDQAFTEWKARHRDMSAAEYAKGDGHGRWQQFVVRLVDERRDAIPDWYVELGSLNDAGEFAMLDFDLNVHKYTNDASFRCFHVDLAKLAAVPPGRLAMRLIASSGTPFLRYYGYGGAKEKVQHDPKAWDAQIGLPDEVKGVTFFYDYTTTLIEVTLNREPMPVDVEPNSVFWWYVPEGA